MDFPHIKDTQFPLIDNVNVYKYQNNFDYARWNGKVSFKLLNVLWNSNYADVPYFDTVAKRDEWFDNQEGYVGTLETLFNNTPDNSIKIPIPFNDAYKYNYLVVDMPMQTSANNPIDYEDSKTRVKRWFYFIDDMTQAAPSTTELELSVDYWTTFIHSVEIPYLMLERGHAPMTKTTVAQYLTNPIMNNEYLLADDFNYGNDTVIQTSNYKPIGNGKKYVLFCAPYHKDDYAKFDGTKWSGNATAPTYSDTSDRWGYQLQVNGYEWKYGNTDYRQADLPIHNGIQSGILNGCECLAIEGIYASDFFNEMAKYHVNFIHGIQAMFILDETLFDITDSFTFNGYTLYIADKKISTENFTFQKAQFNFDSKYSEIAKLYTSPYSMLEITDDEGNSFAAKIENCGRLQMHTEVSLVYPFLNYNVFFSGINGDGSSQYEWEPVYGGKHVKNMWASDFAKFMMNWQVPTYALYVSAENEYAANNATGMEARRLGAIKDYENAVRYANTTRENVADSMATNTANVNRSTTANVADVATTGGANTENTEWGNTCRISDTTAQITKNTDDTKEAIFISDENKSASNEVIANNMDVQNTLTTTTVNEQNEAAVVGISAGSISSSISSVGSLASGDIGGAVTGLANGVGSTYAALCTVDARAAIADATVTANTETSANAVHYNNRVQENQLYFLKQTMDISNTYAQTLCDNANTRDTAQTANTVSANNANAQRDKTANDTNASATQTTETNNATYNRNATIAAEKANLVQKQREAESQYRNARLQRPVTQGSYGGDFQQDVYMRRGVRVNVRTQAKSAIAQAGDAMLRFGYAIHRVWDMSGGFHYGKQFTFWKAEDVWINDGSGVANAATNAIGNILMKGVTVWRDPSKIGTVGIYNNL